MNLLLDTCTFLWLALEPEKLSDRALELFENPRNAVFLSAASSFEIVLKYTAGKLPISMSPERFIGMYRVAHEINHLPIYEEEIFGMVSLPKIHKDPFDRLLVAQAKSSGLTILSSDKRLSDYGVKVEW